MTTAATRPAVHVRLRRSLLGTATVALLLATSPLFGVLYWFAIPTGHGLVVLVMHVVVLLVAVGLGLRQLSIFTEVGDGVLRGNGMFSPLVRLPLERIARVDLVDTYVGLAPTPIRQLLVRDADGARLFRMRGSFWLPGALEEVAAALPVPATVVSEPIDLRDFFRQYPGAAYWFEGRRTVTIVGVVLGVVALAAVAYAAMALAGERFGL